MVESASLEKEARKRDTVQHLRSLKRTYELATGPNKNYELQQWYVGWWHAKTEWTIDWEYPIEEIIDHRPPPHLNWC